MFLLAFYWLLPQQAWAETRQESYTVRWAITGGEVVAFIAIIVAIIAFLWIWILKPKFPSSWELEVENPPDSYSLRGLQRRKFYRLSVSLGSANENIDLGAPGPIGQIIPKYGGKCILKLREKMPVRVDGEEKEIRRAVLFGESKIELAGRYKFIIRV